LTGSVRSVEAEQESLHLRNQHRPLLVLLSLPVPGHAPAAQMLGCEATVVPEEA